MIDELKKAKKYIGAHKIIGLKPKTKAKFCDNKIKPKGCFYKTT